MSRRQKAAKARHKRHSHIPGYTPEAEHAEEIGVTTYTLRKWRRQGKGSAWIKVGRQIHYENADKQRWLSSLKVTPPRSEAAAESRP
jgi:hypothetical protein